VRSVGRGQEKSRNGCRAMLRNASEVSIKNEAQ
jgi:hypothetical protein